MVVDANILRDDVLYAAGHDQRTALANAANAGLIRLFSASHVMEEVLEHSDEWTLGKEVSREAFLQRWLFEYLPLTRVLDIGDDALAMLTPDERSRIEGLRAVDPDDVPSAILSLLLGGIYLTRDGRALRAAYGADVDVAEYEKWREVLRAGGDAGELGLMFQVSIQVALAIGGGVANGIGALARRLGWLAVGAAGATGALLLTRTSLEQRHKAKSILGSAASTISDLLVEYHQASARLRSVSVKAPEWDELASLIAPQELLARACIYTLARPGMSDQSAQSLTRFLPPLGVPHGEAKVRAILRARGYYFSQPWAGRFQLGHVAEPVRKQLDLLGAERSELLGAALVAQPIALAGALARVAQN
ncbi:MAG: PIN domain-containing protein [Acidimicrobiales bacterium]